MTWFYGFRFKYRYTKRIAEELGITHTDPSTLDFLAKRHIQRVTGTHFELRTDYRGRFTLAFVESSRPGDLRRMRATPDQIRAVRRILHGDDEVEREREPRWYSDDPYDVPEEEEEEEEPDDDDPLPLKPKEYYERLSLLCYPRPEIPSSGSGYSTTHHRGTHHRKETSTKEKRSPSSRHGIHAVMLAEGKKSSTARHPSVKKKEDGSGVQRIKVLSAGRYRKLNRPRSYSK